MPVAVLEADHDRIAGDVGARGEQARARQGVGEDEDLGPLDHWGVVGAESLEAAIDVGRGRLGTRSPAAGCAGPPRARGVRSTARSADREPWPDRPARRAPGAAVGERMTPSMFAHSRRRYWNPDSSTTRPWNWRSSSVTAPKSPASLASIIFATIAARASMSSSVTTRQARAKARPSSSARIP